MNAAIYLRVSTRAQADDGISLDMQRTEIRRWLKHEHPGASVVEYVDDGYTGTNLNRPAIERLMGDLHDLDLVVVWRLDRLSRDVVDRAVISDLIRSETGSQPVSVTQTYDDSPEGLLMRELDASLASYESRKIAVRTKAALRRKAETGQLLGKPPYGYTRSGPGVWSVVPHEADIVNRIDEMYLNDGYGWTRIASTLNTERVPSPSGGRWRVNTIEAILRRSIYSGLIEHGATPRNRQPTEIIKAEVSADGFVPIRSRSVHDEIRSELERRSTGKRTGHSVFAGTLRCGGCGSSMHISTTHTKGGKTHRFYVCSQHKRDRTCQWNTIMESDIVSRIQDSVDFLTGSGYSVEVTTRQGNRDGLEQELTEINARRRRLIALVESGAVDAEEVQSQLARLALRRDEVEADLKRDDETIEIVPLDVIVGFSTANAAGPDALRRWVRTTVDRIVWNRSSGEFDLWWKAPDSI